MMSCLSKFLSELRDRRQKLLDGFRANPDYRQDILDDIYPDRAHFIYELLQNAEDVGAREVSFTLSAKRLCFEHDGRPFNKRDVEAITTVGGGTKKDDDDAIGRFGIGFKSVFVYSKTPRIWSPTIAFEISHRVLPSELPPNPSLGKHTRFEFPFNSSKKSKSDAYSEVNAGLEDVSGKTLLFLSDIKSIDWRIVGGKKVRLLRKTHDPHHVEILKETDSHATESLHFLRFTEPVKELEKQYAAIAFELRPLPENQSSSTDSALARRFRIVPAEPGRVAVYFDAAKETSGLRLHLHAPFVPELSRSSVKDTPANEPLFQQLAELTANSLFNILEFGLLDRDFLAVLPNNKDDLPNRYTSIRDAVISAMNERPLTPTHAKSHAPAKRLLQARAGLKSLLTDEDLGTVIDIDMTDPAWAVTATKKNNEVDRFLASLDITEWETEQFVGVLKRGLNTGPSWLPRKPDAKLVGWLSGKSEDWHRALYELLHEQLDEDRGKDLSIVRLSNGGYRIPTECYFPPGKIGEELELPYVAKGTYSSGNGKDDSTQARKFLKKIGVRQVGKHDRVKAILKKRYSKESERPDWTTHEADLRSFVSLVDSDKSAIYLFKEHYIFERADSTWGRPSEAYLDKPHLDTGMSAYYEALGDKAKRVALSERYTNLHNPAEFVNFAKSCGASTRLEINMVQCKSNREWKYLSEAKGYRFTVYGQDQDFVIPELPVLLGNPTEDLSRLVWRTLCRESQNKKYLKARFRKNARYPALYADSQLVQLLQRCTWIPQTNGGFASPDKASAELLPEGFQFDPRWPWIKAIGFGEEKVQRVEERPRNLEKAQELGFEDKEGLDDGLEFAKLSPEIRRAFLARHNRSAELPQRSPRNPKRRAEKVRTEAQDAPGREKVNRRRSVSKHRDAVVQEARPYLRQQYTNDDRIMICQACREALPFKLPDKNEYYFEAVEFLSESQLEKRHYQNYLALCPNHAAMYQHANESKEEMKRLFMSTEGNELEITLATKRITLYFTGTHQSDLKAVIEAENSSEA